MSLPAVDIPTPKFLSDLVSLHFQPEILLDPQTQTRWKLEGDELSRDFEGEVTWAQMAEYVGQTYTDVFMNSYRTSLDIKNG